MELLQLAKLRKTVETVRAENVQYRASNKTEEFEQRIAAMQKQIEMTGEPTQGSNLAVKRPGKLAAGGAGDRQGH